VLRDDTVHARALEALEPIGGDGTVGRDRAASSASGSSTNVSCEMFGSKWTWERKAITLRSMTSSTVNAEDGVVYLRGEAPTSGMIDDLVAETRQIQGVRDVENLLHLPDTPAPTND
jgi:osmotically-inducible protein OsmY